MDCLKSIDMMGKEFRFNVDGMSAFKTSLGGFMTIFKLIAFLVLIWYFGQDIYNRKEPVLLITNSMDDQYPNITLDSTIFNFAYRVEDAYGLTIDDPSYFTYDIIFQELESGSDNIFKELNRDTTELEKCSEKHFKREVLDFYNLQNYRCHENNFTLGGSWGASFIKVPQYFLRLCDSKTEVKYNVKCKTKDEIINQFGNIYMDTYIQKNLVNPSNFGNPIQQTFSYSYKEIKLKSVNSINAIITYGDSRLHTDTGFIFSDITSKGFLEFESLEMSEAPYQEDWGPYLASVSIYVSRNVKTYTREYKKISKVLAEAGGIMSLAEIVISILFDFYLINEYTCFLQEKILSLNKDLNPDEPLNHLKEVSMDRNINQQEVLNEQLNLNIPKDNNMSNINLVPIPSSVKKKSLKIKLFHNDNKDIILNKDIHKIIEFKNHELEPVHISSSERCYYNCCYNTKKLGKNDLKSLKFKLLTVYQRELDKRLEILELMKMKDQFKMIKKIVLNENQCFMLQNRDLHKIIDCKIISDEDKLLDNQKYEQLNKEKLIQYLKLKKEKNNISSIDVLLYKYMSLDLKSEISNIVNIED